MAVIRVNEDRAAARMKRQDRGDATKCAALCSVSVNDVRPVVPKNPDQRPKGLEIDDAGIAAHAGHTSWLDAQSLRQAVHVALVCALGAPNQPRGVAERLETARECGRLDCPPADV